MFVGLAGNVCLFREKSTTGAKFVIWLVVPCHIALLVASNAAESVQRWL